MRYPITRKIIFCAMLFAAALSAAPGTAAARDEIMFEEGLDLCDQGKYREAIRKFSSLIGEFPASSWCDDAAYLMGECELTLGNSQAAISQFKSVVMAADSPELAADAQYMVASCYGEIGRVEEAVAAYRELVNNFPRSVRVEAARRYIQAHAVAGEETESDRTAPVEQPLQKTVPAASDDVLSPEAVLEIEKVLKTAPPGSGDAELYNLGLSMHTAGRVAAAVVVYKRLLTLFPDTLWKADVWYMIGESYVSMSRLEEAILAYRHALKWSTSMTLSADAQFMIAECAMGLKNGAEALENYRLLIDNFPASDWVADAQFMIGEIHRTRGDFKQASEVYRALVERFPGSRWKGDVEAYLSSIGTEHMAGNVLPPTTAEARAVHTGGDLEKHRDLGLRYKAHGDYVRALEEFKRVLDIDPIDVESTVICALIHHHLGQLDQAVHLLDKARALEPDNLEILSLFGYLSYLAGKYEQSIEAYMKVVAADPEGRFGDEANRALRTIRSKLE